MSTHGWQCYLSDERVCDVEERRHSHDISGAFDRNAGNKSLLPWDEAKRMALNSRKNYGEKYCKPHGHCAEHAKATELGQWTREADKEAYNGGDKAQYHRTRGRAVRQCVEKLRANEAVKCCGKKSARSCWDECRDGYLE